MFTDGCLERGWVEKDSAMPLKLPTVNQSLGHYLLMFFYLAQGTKYLREASRQKAFYPSVYQIHLQSKMKSSLIPGILSSFYLWFWCMTHSLHTDCRFLFSPMDISRPTRFYEPCHHKLRRKLCCRLYRKTHRNISRLPLSSSRMDLFYFLLEGNMPSELGNLTRKGRSRLTWQDTAKELKPTSNVLDKLVW